VVEAMLKGMLEAQAFIAFPANRSVVLKTMMQQMKLNDPITLEEGYQDLLVGFERKPYGTPEGLRNIQRMMSSLNPNVSRVSVDELIDNRFVRKLDENGFIDALYAKR
ncbi:MAG TPA: hypothetical protein VNT76_05380, partial [Candidatus Binatus sp.]|nr:hypothetical protein [Candidatus Binatus sp.]